MKRRASSLVALIATVASVASLVAPTDASACGGVFVRPTDKPRSRDIVRDHRMAIAIGRDKTVVWDEVRLTGDPEELVWITPVRPGTKVELADDEWLSALDVSSEPVVYSPLYESAGCALAGCAADEASSAATGSEIFVVKEQVLGPYDSVTVRAAGDPDAPYRWLVANGYAVPEHVAPTLRTYAEQGFDFAALKLRAGCDDTAVQPVRLVIPGPEPRILLRMALAGAGAEIPITLFVVAETPYQPKNYPSVVFDDDALEWERPTSRSSSSSTSPTSSETLYGGQSNYDDVANDIMQREGRTWVVELARRAELDSERNRLPTPGLFEAYDALCKAQTPRNASTRYPTGSSDRLTSNESERRRCPDARDAGRGDGASEEDAGEDDGGEDDGGEDDASADASDAAAGDASRGDAADASDGATEPPTDASSDASPDASSGQPDASTPRGPSCRLGADSDYALATREVTSSSRVYVTRLRARIRPTVLTEDLELAPAPELDVSNLHQVVRYEDERDRPSRRSCAHAKIRRARAPAGTWALGAAAAFGLAAWLRRMKRR